MSNHKKIGLVHHLAKENLKNAEKQLNSNLIQLEDRDFLPRFKNNLQAFLDTPDAAMIRVALCAGCRVGISGKLFQEAEKLGITKMVNGSSYLEQSQFKDELLRIKGEGDGIRGLLLGLSENHLYYSSNNLITIIADNEHRHTTCLSDGTRKTFYPDTVYLDFYKYLPNIPEMITKEVKNKLGWKGPTQQEWRFDCLVEPFKNLFYYGLLGYTETENKLSKMIRHGLITKKQALIELNSERRRIIGQQEYIFELLNRIGSGDLSSQFKKFIKKSKYFS